jgi:rhodanese-related sulfurtransferase
MEIEIEPGALVELLRAQGCYLLDCRETFEYEAARIDGGTLIPMREIPTSLDRIPKDQPVVVYCHHGNRSLNVALWLRRQGVEASSLAGGIDRWSLEVDAAVPRY